MTTSFHKLNLRALRELLTTEDINPLHLIFLKYYAKHRYIKDGKQLKAWLICYPDKQWTYRLKIEDRYLIKQEVSRNFGAKLLMRSQYYQREYN